MEIAKAVDFEEVLQIVEDLSLEKSVEDRIMQMEAAMLSMPQPECPLEHHLAPGIYRREIFVPANTFFTTETHKTEHEYWMVSGDMMVWEQDKGWERITAPAIGRTMPGTKRIVLVLEDVIFNTIHANPDNITEIKELHNMIFEPYNNPYLKKQEELQ